MDPLQLELAYRMLRLEQRFFHAANCIVASWKGIKARRYLRKKLFLRKYATLYI